MSKKEQKLKKNLYKALTEYFIHNVKNSLSSSENILDQLASFRMETRLPAALRQDKKYQKAQKNCNKANEKMQDLNLTPQQWDAVDATITAENINTGVFSGCPYYISDSYQRHIPSLCQLRNNFFSKISHKAQYYQLTLKISTKKEPLISQKSQTLRFYLYSISPNCTILA